MRTVLSFRVLSSASRRWVAALVAAVLALTGLTIAVAPPAAAAVTVTPLGWNVVGLDSNKVTVGPNQFPVGARVCSIGTAATLSATWQWQSVNANINLVGGPGVTPETFPDFTLGSGQCRDLYWTVEITRTTAAYFTSRNFQINVSDGTTTVSTPAGRQIYVEKLVSQNRNVVYGVTGPGIGADTTPLLTGQTYQYTVTGATAPGGYEQLVFAAIFPPSLFEIVSVVTTYTANSSAIVPNPNDQVYANGCGWNNTTRACTGTGKVGGSMSSTYTVRAIGAGSGRVVTEIYDFSGSSYHYNADFGASAPTVTVKQAVPNLAVAKSSQPTTFDSSGDTLTFTVSATNTGNVPLTNVSIADPLLANLHLQGTVSDPCEAATLAVGATLTCVGTYVTDEDDVIAGKVTNTATATGTPPGGSAFTRQGSTEVPGPQPVASLSVVKSSTPTFFDTLAEPIAYTVVATNTGNVTLTNVTVTDPLLGGNLSCPTAPDTLAPGASMTCTGTRNVTQADLDAGQILNTATATGTPPAVTGLPPATGTDDLVVPGPQVVPALSIIKSSSPTVFAAAGEDVLFTVTATNTGNVTLSDVTVDDPLVDSAGDWTCVPATPAMLAPGQAVECSGTYATTVGDEAAGQVSNTATATGTPPSGPNVTDETTIVVPGPDPGTPDITVVKSASPLTYAENDVITYTVTATNTGTTALTGVDVSDPTVTNLTCPGAPVNLAVGASLTCSGTYTATAADVTAGSITNVATGTGTGPGGNEVTDEDTVVVEADTNDPRITVTKSASPLAFTGAGETITYTIVVTNTGGTTLNPWSATDPLLPTLVCSGSGGSALGSGDSATCTGTYITTPSDVTAGLITNTVTAQGTSGARTVTDTDTADVVGPPNSAELSVVKTADQTSFAQVGDPIDFTVTVTNTGGVALTGVEVADPLLDGLPDWTCTPSTPAALAVGASITCTAAYEVTQSDVEKGFVRNVATATSNETGPDEATGAIDVPGPTPAPELSVAKVSDPVAFTAAGETLDFTIVATNTGNVPLSGVSVSDPLLGALDCTPTIPTALGVGASITCTGSYLTDTDDVVAGGVENTATATGTPPSGPDVTGETTVVVPGPAPAPELSVVKTASPVVFANVDDVITYTVVATNTGNVPLSAVEVSDPLLPSLSCPGAPVALAVGASLTCTGSYTVTQDDVDAGEVLNTATASGEDPGGDPVEGEGSSTVPGPTPVPGLLLTKAADVPYFTAAGETITYTLVAENTGNVTLTGVVVEDPLLGALDCTPAAPVDLAVGASITCTGDYVTDADDVSYGGVENAASATGIAPDESEVTSEASVLVPSATPQLSVVKTSDRETFTAPGQTIIFTVEVANVGNVPLYGVTVSDPLLGAGLACTPTPPVDLDPLEGFSCTGSYVTGAADMSAQQVVNTALATGTTEPSGGGEQVTGDGTVIVTGPAPTPEPTPEPTQTPAPSPTASPSASPTISPTPGPTPTVTPAPERLPQVPKKALPVPEKVKPFGSTVLLPARVMTNAGQPAKVRVDCTIPRQARGLVPVLLSPSAPKGDVRLCLVKRGRNGKVSVTVLVPPPVKVTMTLSAPPKGKYGPYKQVISYTTRMRNG